MAGKNTEDTGISDDSAATGGNAASADTVTNEELSELRILANSLLEAAGTLQAQRTQAAEFRGLIDDVRTATRTMALSSPGVAVSGHPAEVPRGECGCGPCECLSPACCLFEVVLTHARATEMQLLTEPFDSNVSPLAHMEIRMFAHIGGIGALVPPDFTDTLALRKNIAKPGGWKLINQKIGTVAVCRGQSKSLLVVVQAAEIDEVGIEAAGLRDELGTGTANLVLNCCMSEPFTCLVDVQLSEYGLGGGAIEVKFEAKKICC